jgi:hypothetical protein
MSPCSEVRNMIVDVFQHNQNFIFTMTKNKNLSNFLWLRKFNRRFSHIFRKLRELDIGLSD